jgi:glutathione synthase/RimK-type ligase-like ATP-grasp enzyme
MNAAVFEESEAMRLAVLTPHTDREPRADWTAALAHLSAALEAEGARVVTRSWTAPDALDGIDAASPLMVWAYHLDADLWRHRLEGWATSPVPFANRVQVLRWNTDKAYLAELAGAGAPVVPTLAVDAVTPEALAEAADRFGPSLVAKPRISAGAHQTARVEDGVAMSELPDGPALIQPFLPAVGEEGELSLIFFAGEFSHAVTKVAKPGDFRVQPQYGSALTRVAPPDEALAAARMVLDAAPAHLAYARVDLIRIADGSLALMELELIEPDLYLRHAPDRAEAFARTLLGAVR